MKSKNENTQIKFVITAPKIGTRGTMTECEAFLHPSNIGVPDNLDGGVMKGKKVPVCSTFSLTDATPSKSMIGRRRTLHKSKM